MYTVQRRRSGPNIDHLTGARDEQWRTGKGEFPMRSAAQDRREDKNRTKNVSSEKMFSVRSRGMESIS